MVHSAPFAIRRLKFGIGYRNRVKLFKLYIMSSDDDDDMILAAANFIIIKHSSKKNKNRKVRRWWMISLNKNRVNYGGNHLLTPEIFGEVLGLIEPLIAKKNTNFRKAILPIVILIFLRVHKSTYFSNSKPCE
ncbi:hypothetical protein QTP88_018039 [Uroleucon formosanum]